MKIAIIQLNSKLDPKENLKQIHDQINLAKKSSIEPIEAVFLPEVFYSISNGQVTTPYLIKGENEHYLAIQNIAIKHGVYLLGGSAASEVNGKILNRAYNFSPTGELISFYDKIHLFAVNLSGGSKSLKINEADIYGHGSKASDFKISDWHFGSSICFDVRFPELYREYFKRGCNVLTIPAAFTVPTGQAHWSILLRARAIENQSYVIAVGQWGKHNEKIETYGHSMVIDPWGKIICEIESGVGFAICDLNFDHLTKIKGRMDMQPRF